jgi:aldose 1-epimerase
MAPWVGRTGWGRFSVDGTEHRLAIDHPPHAIHGTVRGVAWQVDEAGADRAVLSAPLGPGWPWPGRCEHALTLAGDCLTLTATVTAAPGAAFPAAVGWHPWFVKPSAVELEAAAMLERGDDHLPTGRRVPPPTPGDRPLDDCFEDVRWPVTVTFPDGFTLRVDAEGCRYAVLYDEPQDATCVEPSTAPPDALRSGETTLVEPDRPLRATMRLRWG